MTEQNGCNKCDDNCKCGCKDNYIKKNKRDKNNILNSNLDRTIYVYKLANGREKTIIYKHADPANKGKWSDETETKQRIKTATEFIKNKYDDKISIMKNWYIYKEQQDKDKKPFISYSKFLPIAREAINKPTKQYKPRDKNKLENDKNKLENDKNKLENDKQIRK